MPRIVVPRELRFDEFVVLSLSILTFESMTRQSAKKENDILFCTYFNIWKGNTNIFRESTIQRRILNSFSYGIEWVRKVLYVYWMNHCFYLKILGKFTKLIQYRIELSTLMVLNFHISFIFIWKYLTFNSNIVYPFHSIEKIVVDRLCCNFLQGPPVSLPRYSNVVSL